MKKEQKIPLILMLLALLGLMILQAFWINTSVKAYNKETKAKLEESAVRLKEALEDDYFCFQLSQSTQINKEDSLAIIHFNKADRDTLGSYLINYEGKEMVFPKNIFEFRIPTNVQLELRFDYLMDSLSTEELERDIDLLEMQNEYRKDAVIDSINGMRVAYKGSLKRIVENELSWLIKNSEFRYTVEHKESKRQVFESEYSLKLEQVLEFPLYNNPQRFGDVYVFRLYTEKLWKKALVEFRPLLLFSVLTLTIAWGMFFYALRSWRKERMFSKLRKDMMQSLSHEMNTPISNIQLALHSIKKRESELKNENAAYLDILEEENSKLAGNVERLLEYAQMEDEGGGLELHQVDINSLIRECLEGFTKRLKISQGRFDFFESPENPIILGDRNHLENMFHNLLENALKYSNNDLKVEIYSDVQNSKLTLNFMDNNSPIPKKVRRRVFEKYFRNNSIQDDKIQGYGLGLYYVKRVVDLHGGAIKIKDSHLGGNDFEVILPFTQ